MSYFLRDFDDGIDFSDFDSDKKQSAPPMGPKHPCWNLAKIEVADLLKKSGRIFDDRTVEQIAMDPISWSELITEAGANMRERTRQTNMDALLNMVRGIRTEAESKIRINKLFGGNTEVGK